MTRDSDSPAGAAPAAPAALPSPTDSSSDWTCPRSEEPWLPPLDDPEERPVRRRSFGPSYPIFAPLAFLLRMGAVGFFLLWLLAFLILLAVFFPLLMLIDRLLHREGPKLTVAVRRLRPPGW